MNDARTPKIRAQASTRTKQDLGTILWPIDENVGTNLQALSNVQSIKLSENTKIEMICTKKFLFFNSAGRYVNLAGRKTVRAVCKTVRAGCKTERAGRKTVRAGRSTIRNMSSWNTGQHIVKI